LIEVLVALLIFSFGVLGVVGMQARALQFSTQAGDRARAAMLANEIVSQMWTQQSPSLDAAKIDAWKIRIRSVAAGLPSGEGNVALATASDGSVTATVTVTWKPPSLAGTTATNRYFTTVVMP
jgi:type IV pilus assembly protein PilV